MAIAFWWYICTTRQSHTLHTLVHANISSVQYQSWWAVDSHSAGICATVVSSVSNGLGTCYSPIRSATRKTCVSTGMADAGQRKPPLHDIAVFRPTPGNVCNNWNHPDNSIESSYQLFAIADNADLLFGWYRFDQFENHACFEIIRNCSSKWVTIFTRLSGIVW